MLADAQPGLNMTLGTEPRKAGCLVYGESEGLCGQDGAR